MSGTVKLACFLLPVRYLVRLMSIELLLFPPRSRAGDLYETCSHHDRSRFVSYELCSLCQSISNARPVHRYLLITTAHRHQRRFSEHRNRRIAGQANEATPFGGLGQAKWKESRLEYRMRLVEKGVGEMALAESRVRGSPICCDR